MKNAIIKLIQETFEHYIPEKRATMFLYIAAHGDKNGNLILNAQTKMSYKEVYQYFIGQLKNTNFTGKCRNITIKTLYEACYSGIAIE